MTRTEIERTLSRAARRFGEAVGNGDLVRAERWLRIAFVLQELLLEESRR